MIVGGSELDERVWGRRALYVLQSPRTVFRALRSEQGEVAGARQEAVSALVLLAGIGAVLAVPQTGRLLDDPAVDTLLVAVLVVLTGFLYGIAGYWLGGAIVRVGERAVGGGGSYRRTRHLVAYAAAPLALSLLVLWPIRIALHGDDLFRTAGADGGTAGTILARLQLLFVAWSLALVVLGLRILHGWGWPRAALASAPLGLSILAIVAVAGLAER
jgi:hypothetical protein